MPKFALLFSGAPTDVPAGTDTDSAWMTWVKTYQQSGAYHSGSAFPMQGNIVTKGQASPFSPDKNSLGGYVVIDAADLAAATETAKTTPHAVWGGAVEIRPCRDLS